MRSLAPLLLLAACTDSGSSPTTALQMNDLSVMFPLPQTTAAFDAMLPANAPALEGGEILPQATFESGSPGVLYEGLVAVAFRLDPCFGNPGTISDGPGCQNQLRIVFQPLFDSGGGVAMANDIAVHAFYDISRSELLQIIDEIRAAREEAGQTTDLGPLQMHPIIVDQGNDGAFAQHLRGILTEHAGASKLVRFTTLQIEEIFANSGDNPPVGGSEFWIMNGFDVASGTAAGFAIPTLPDGSLSETFTAGVDPLLANGSPATTAADNILAISDPSTAPTVAQEQAAVDAALRIENPLMHSPNTIDCVSCHLAPPARQLNASELTGSPGTEFQPAAQIPADDLVQTTDFFTDEDEVLNIHAFSYRNGTPMINQRVINETAANLAYLSAFVETAPSD
ncbi:MAG TPA: hypothetical protein VGM88_10840 [Kofleriaceae bacterium]|jgi:hypothetical protein